MFYDLETQNIFCSPLNKLSFSLLPVRYEFYRFLLSFICN